MSDTEEPPMKMSKYVEEYLEDVDEGMEAGIEEGMEEGQEEWLSEGVLTDDDYMQTVENDKSDTNNTSQDDQDTMQSLDQSETMDHNLIIDTKDQKDSIITQDIEEQLNNLDNTKNEDELSQDLDAFLIRKTDGKVVEAKVREENILKTKDEKDDGNDTDDLLRLLGDGDHKTKKKALKIIKKDKLEDPGSSDDEFIYEKSQVKTFKVAKNALMKRTATKAEPEDMSDGDDEIDQSSDDGSIMQRMFNVKKAPPVEKEPVKKIVKHVVQVDTNHKKADQKTNTPNNTPKSTTKQTTPKPGILQKPTILQKPPIIQKPPIQQKSGTLPKPGTLSKPAIVPKPAIVQKPGIVSKPGILQKPTILQKRTSKAGDVKTPAPFKPLEKLVVKETSKSDVKETSKKKDEIDEIIDEEEFLEEDDIDLDEEEFGEESEGEVSKKQRIMRPEMMDEEVPSDAESRSEDGSLYDELPSSDSEDLDDWFTLDIRAERAGDYLPLLGSKAHELLEAERRRVSSRVATLRQSLSALTDSARRQADQLRSAAMALAEIDDTLRAA